MTEDIITNTKNKQALEVETQALDKNTFLTTQSRRIVFDSLMQGFNQIEAAKKARLSHGYVRYWITKNNIHELVRQEKAKIDEKIARDTETLRQECIEKLDDIINEEDVPRNIKISAIKELGDLCGWHRTTINYETPMRQLQLEAAQRKEAQRLAIAMHNPHLLESGPVIEVDGVSESPDDDLNPQIESEDAETGMANDNESM